MSENGTIEYLVTQYENARSIHEELAAQEKEAKAQMDAAEKELIMAILSAEEAAGVDSLKVNCNGRNYGATIKTFYTIPKADRDDAFEELRNLGHGDLITEKVDDRTLTKELQSVIASWHREHAEEDYPPEYEVLMSHVSRYDKPSLSRVLAR